MINVTIPQSATPTAPFTQGSLFLFGASRELPLEPRSGSSHVSLNLKPCLPCAGVRGVNSWKSGTAKRSDCVGGAVQVKILQHDSITIPQSPLRGASSLYTREPFLFGASRGFPLLGGLFSLAFCYHFERFTTLPFTQDNSDKDSIFLKTQYGALPAVLG